MKGERFLWSVSKINDLKSLLKSALTGKDTSSWSFPSFVLTFLLPIWQVWFVTFRRLEEVCEIGAIVFAGVIFFIFFLAAFLLWARHFFQILWSFCRFHLAYLLKAHMKLNGRKWLDKIEQMSSEKNQTFLVLNEKCFFCLLTFNSRADIITRYKNCLPEAVSDDWSQSSREILRWNLMRML